MRHIRAIVREFARQGTTGEHEYSGWSARQWSKFARDKSIRDPESVVVIIDELSKMDIEACAEYTRA